MKKLNMKARILRWLDETDRDEGVRDGRGGVKVTLEGEREDGEDRAE
jgi:hypothetical protein